MNVNNDFLAQSLANGLAALGLALDAWTQDRLLRYLMLLNKWNKVYNLTAVRAPDEMLTHHLLDSLAVIPALRRHTQGKAVRVLDVGSGGGLPGVVIALSCPEMDVTCVDAVAKKMAFIRQVASALVLPNLHGLHARVEVLQQKSFDVIASRAFASLPDFTGLSRGALAEQGVWMAMKGKRPDDELAALPEDVHVFHVEQLEVPDLHAQRCLVWLRPAVGHAA